MTTQHTMPANIILDKWQDIGFEWAGEIALADFVRLSEQMSAQADNRLQVTVRLSKQSGHQGLLRLDYQVLGVAVLPCDRCLAPIEVALPDHLGMYVLTDDSQTHLVEDEDFVLMSELGGDGRTLPIKDILEDELILSLPTTLRHEDCQMAVTFEEEVPDNPFAALAALKGKL